MIIDYKVIFSKLDKKLQEEGLTQKEFKIIELLGQWGLVEQKNKQITFI